MKNHNGKPENGNDARVLKIAEVCRPDSRGEPKNPFPDRDVFCSGAGEMCVKIDRINPDKSATVSIVDASGREIDSTEIAEGETRNIAGRAITLIGISLLMGAAACEYNYNYGSDEDATTNPPSVCSTIQVTDRCEGDNPNQRSCTAYEGSAVDFDGYLFRVADVLEESGVTKVYVDVLEQSLDCRLLHTLELTVGMENGFSVGTDNYTILPRWAEMGADPDAPAVVGLDIAKASIEPAGPVCAEETDRCYYRDTEGVRCVTYENRAVLFDNYLFTVMAVDGTTITFDVQDKESCYTSAFVFADAGGEETFFTPSVGMRYAIRVRSATPRSTDIPAKADVEIRRVSDEPTPAVCPEVTDRCSSPDAAHTSCRVYQDMAAEFEGVLFSLKDMREEGGARKLTLEVIDSELGCGVLQTAVIDAGGGADIEIEGRYYYVQLGDITLDAAGNWAYMFISRPYSFCEVAEPADCERSADSVRCTANPFADYIDLGGNKFVINSIVNHPDGTKTITILSCTSDSEVSFDAPGTATLELGPYRYRFTVFGIDAETWSSDIQIEREPLLCEGEQTSNLVNVGEFVTAADAAFMVRLDDISRAGEAMLTILDPDFNEIETMNLGESETKLFELGGRIYMITASDIAAGVLLIGKRAEITIDACF
ncbi:hypothetical protein H0O01_04505 [Candidatus Micrarchaeota archaeon]|nr:hypothetical protein [Candidatus Micrarchaeota archaeon]